MKYGETLRQRSIPAWSHHNIDYDEVKHFIKENTTPSKGKSISVPGRGDDKLREFQDELFDILADQHQRIDLFVRSKSGEIQRRLDHAKKQIRQIATRQAPITEKRIPISRLERYGKLENDIIKAGDEIRSLARFTATQRTAFRKLLKKYKKWTGSAELEDRFREEVLDNHKSFTRSDLGPLLDDYSATRQSIRALYERQVQQSQPGRTDSCAGATLAGSAATRQLRNAVHSGSMVRFDTDLATIPLGDNGTFATYFVHPENVVELQMLLLLHTRFFLTRSRSNSIATPVTSESQTMGLASSQPDLADFHMLAADDLDRFAQEQGSLTVDDREHCPGSSPQRAKAAVRWNSTEDALACVRASSRHIKSASLKRKYVHDFFDRDADFRPKQQLASADKAESVEHVRRELLKENARPLFHYAGCRSRLTGLDDDAEGIVLAALDTGVTIENASKDKRPDDRTTFPFALLFVRQEGRPKSDLFGVLNSSYLVERVRGFSLEYHAVWQTHQSANIPAPFWLPILSRDIRKLPPPALKRPSRDESGTGTRSAGSNGSTAGTTDSVTAVETSNDGPARMPTPPLQSFRKKKRRSYPVGDATPQRQQRYWSEYDHPEDNDDSADAFVIYIDPNERTVLDRFFDKLQTLFRRKRPEEEPLLESPATPRDDESSSDDEEASPLTTKPSRKTFGTFQSNTTRPGKSLDSFSTPVAAAASAGLSHFAATCFAASLAILLVAYILRSTGRHKLLREVHYGVLFAVVCSLAFALIGFMAVMRGGMLQSNNRPGVSLGAWGVSITVLLVDVLGAGALIAWMVG